MAATIRFTSSQDRFEKRAHRLDHVDVSVDPRNDCRSTLSNVCTAPIDYLSLGIIYRTWDRLKAI